jgi:hypothetical protein
VIGHGAATGIDASFAQACDDLGVEQEPHPARWKDLKARGAVIRHDRRKHHYNANAGPERKAERSANRPENAPASPRTGDQPWAAPRLTASPSPALWQRANCRKPRAHQHGSVRGGLRGIPLDRGMWRGDMSPIGFGARTRAWEVASVDQTEAG